ncbi:MAG: M14 family zinc carboxypeptidase, partial [Pseudonocardiaceae bacterium]
MSLRHVAMIATLATLALTIPLSATAAQPPQPQPDPVSTYRVEGVDTPAERTAVAREGVDVLSGGHDYLEIRATAEAADQLRAAGLQLVPLPPTELPAVPLVGGFPSGFDGYHTYDELSTELRTIAETRPDVVTLSSYGRSFEGRSLPLVKISDAARTDENEPEVLFTCAQHA